MPRWIAKNLFQILLGGGAAVSCGARYFLDRGGEQLLSSVAAVVICICCLLAYYIFAARTSAGDADTHAPENLYYMGFLFTLISLIYSVVILFVVSDGGESIEQRVYHLVGSFGIALASTFFGILFRILLLQKISPDAPGKSAAELRGAHQRGAEHESARMAHRDLVEAAYKLRQELTQTIADMGAFRSAVIQAAHESARESGKARAAMLQQIETAAAEQTKMLANVAAAMGDKLAEAGDGVVASAANVKKSLDELAARQSDQTRGLIESGAQSAEQMQSGIRKTLEQINDSGEKVGHAFGAILEPLQNVARDIHATHKNINTLSAEFDSLNVEIQRSVSLFSGALREMEHAAQTINTETKSFSDSMSETAKIGPQYAEQVAQLLDALRRETEQWQSMTQEVRGSLVDAVEALSAAIER